MDPELTLECTVRERYMYLIFLPKSASRALVMGVFKDISDVLSLSDQEIAEWGFVRVEGGVGHKDPDYDWERDRVPCTMARTKWNRIRAGANAMLDFPNTTLAVDCYERLHRFLDKAAVIKKATKGSRPDLS